MTWNFATISEVLRDAKYYGYDVPENVPFDYARFKRGRDAIIKRLNGAYERNWGREGIDLVQGTARFTGQKEIEVDLQDGSGRTKFTAPHILIASGSHPIVPQIPGAEHGITSDEFFEIEDLPPKLAVVGAGYIAVELAGVMQTVGVETHMFIRGETFLRKFDPMIQDTMTKRYEDVGMHIHRNFSSFKEVKLIRDGKGTDKLLRLVADNGEEFEVNELLWAIGRAPQVSALGIQDIGIKQNGKGHIVVDEFQNTSVDGIYALGDVTGQAELTPGNFSSFCVSFVIGFS